MMLDFPDGFMAPGAKWGETDVTEHGMDMQNNAPVNLSAIITLLYTGRALSTQMLTLCLESPLESVQGLIVLNVLVMCAPSVQRSQQVLQKVPI